MKFIHSFKKYIYKTLTQECQEKLDPNAWNNNLLMGCCVKLYIYNTDQQ